MTETNTQHPRLDEMDEREATRFLTGLAAELSPEGEYGIRHEDDYVMEMPQSGERIRGRENVWTFQESYGDNATPPNIRIRRVIVREGLWIAESVIDYGGQISHGAAILELRDGKVWRDTRYFAEPFEPQPWRSQWVERMEPEEVAGVPDVLVAGGRTMSEDEVRRLVERQLAMMRAGDFAGAHEWYDEAAVVEWPQSGERIRGRENLLALRQAYPAGVRFEARRVLSRQDLGVGEYIIRYDGRPVHVLAVVEFGNGKVIKETHYFAEPFEAPEWRARWVERREPEGRDAATSSTLAGPSVAASAEGNKAVVLRYVEEVWNRHDLAVIDELVSTGYVNHAASTEEYRHGGARRIWEWLLSVFPDHRFEVEDAAADGETVAIRGTMTGTHEGELLGIAPTGKRVAAQQSHWFRVVDGKLAEHWAVRDDLGMMRQLGVTAVPT